MMANAGPAAAQDDGTRESEARGLFAAGAAAYDGGRYDEALQYFRRAYDLSGRPGLLYNIASAAERTREDELALRSYEQYLAQVPDAPNRPRVETRIEALRRQLAEARAVPAPAPPQTEPPSAPPAPDAPPPSSGSEPDLAGPIALFGVAAAGLVTFAIAGGLTIGENESLAASCGSGLASPRCTDAELSGLSTLAAVADVGWIAAAIAATAGAVWLALALSSGGGSEQALRIAPWASASSGGLVLSGDLEVF